MVLVIPLLAAFLLKSIINKKQGVDWFYKKIMPRLDFTSQFFLNLAIVSMFASQGKMIVKNPEVFVKIFVPLMIFFTINFIFSLFCGRLLKFDYPTKAALTMTVLARNSPLSLAIVLASFPDQPLAALVLVIGPLIELPILAVSSYLLLFLKRKNILGA